MAYRPAWQTKRHEGHWHVYVYSPEMNEDGTLKLVLLKGRDRSGLVWKLREMVRMTEGQAARLDAEGFVDLYGKCGSWHYGQVEWCSERECSALEG